MSATEEAHPLPPGEFEDIPEECLDYPKSEVPPTTGPPSTIPPAST